MPSMHQMQEITPEEKWNAYEARRAARRQLRRRGVTATPSIPESDPAGMTPVPEAPEKGMMPHPEMPYSLSIDLSGVAAVNEEPCQPAEEACSMPMMDDVPEWVVTRHLERRLGTIEVEAPTGGDAFVPEEVPRPENTPHSPKGVVVVSDEPEWVAKRRLAPTRRSDTTEVEAPSGRDTFVSGKNLESEGVPINDPDSEEPEWATKRCPASIQRPSMIEAEAPIGRDAFILERTLEPGQTVREWTMTTHALQTAIIEPGNKRNSLGSPGWTTVSYRKTTGRRTSPADREHRHEMTRSRNELEKSRSGRPRWRGSPEISSQVPGMDTGGNQDIRKPEEDPISRSPFEGDAREFAERSRMLLQTLRSNPEFAALSRSEQRSLLAELIEEEGQNDAEGNDPPAKAMTRSEEDRNETLMLLEEDDSWQEDNSLQRNEAADDEWKSRSPCRNRACEDAPMEHSRKLLEILRRNPEFEILSQSKQRQVFAELLENEEECTYLLTLKEEGSYSDTGCALTEERNGPSAKREDDRRKENDDATEKCGQKSRSPRIDRACGDASIKQSRILLKALRKNLEFTVLPRSEQKLVFAELLENEEECEYLLAQSGEGGCDNEASTGEDNNFPTKQENDVPILQSENLRPGKINPETADYWAQLIKNLSREESDEFLDDLLKGTTNDLSESEFD
ncbi:hypothetical protein H4582DRAFT_2194549 [Lactarius indigo]|nr:hypothetical protein H4582DRAFT_2194549 [Lactarius indigo]